MRVVHERSMGTYVYCVGSAESFGPDRPGLRSRGVGGPDVEVRTVEYADLMAVVSDAPVTACEATQDNLMAHERVVEEAMSRSDVLPVAFGTVAPNDHEVQEKLLHGEHDTLQRCLAFIRGRVELALKALWNQDRVFFEIAAERDDIRSLRDLIASRPPGTAKRKRIQLGKLTAKALGDKRDRDAKAVLDALSPLAVNVHLNRLLTDMMILNASFLVDKDRIEAFDAQVQRLGEIQADRLVFQYTT
jgi:Gas vesicle synthesis protein GvpL/GvpF